MTQEEKELLIKDICSRLPYGVKVQIDLQSNIYPPMICKVCNIEFTEMGGSFIGVEVLPDSYCEYREFLCKPYLFPLSSMTEEQRNEYHELLYNPKHGIDIDYFDWCHKNHFDCRGLIKKGLAVDATNLNIY
jgi:hypothetical protein